MERSEFADIASGRAKYAGGSAASDVGGKWKPETFGEVRLACIAWLVLLRIQRSSHAVRLDGEGN